ncbi:hypothetical protein [Streptomyces sp. NPDC002057]|uniref:hypothetical protein n=1 Tax=Streptomyces sp. NPDC002057 TaxID=3154664 RepID=UPI003321FF90
MHGQHARPASTLFGSAPSTRASLPGRTGPKHSRRGRSTGRFRRRILAYRAIEFLSTHLPDLSGPGEECLLLIHIRQVVGEVHYRICSGCSQGVITAVVIDERFHSSGLGTRALLHLRSRHPGIAWSSVLNMRTTRDLLRRMRITAIAPASPTNQQGTTPPPHDGHPCTAALPADGTAAPLPQPRA